MRHLIEALDDLISEKRIDWATIEKMLNDAFKESGLKNLGERYGKRGDHWGAEGGSKMVRVGRRELVMMVWSPSYQYGKLKGTWGSDESMLLSKLTPEKLKQWARIVKDAPTMKEMRTQERGQQAEKERSARVSMRSAGII